MQFSTVFASIAMAATAASAAAIPAADRQVMNKRQTVFGDGSVTWYAGESLQAPACGGATPNDSSNIVAVATSSPATCGDWVHLHYNGNMVAAQVVDECAACAPHQVDATKGVFQALAPLEQGQLEGVHLVLFSNN